MLAREGRVAFLRGASRASPWFLVFAPSAPHAPWTPALQDAGSFDGVPIAMPGSAAMNDVSGAPGWVRALPRDGDRCRDTHAAASTHAGDAPVGRSRPRASRGGDRCRDELERTLIVVLTDNGFSFGEHRWVENCHYDACIRVPLVMRAPWAEPGTVAAPVSIVDLAPTVLDLVGTVSTSRRSRPTVSAFARGWAIRPEGKRSAPGCSCDGPATRGSGLGRDPDLEFAFFEHADGTIELYDVAGAIGVADPASYATGPAIDDTSTSSRARLALSALVAARPRPAGLTLHCASCNRRAPNPPCWPARVSRSLAAAPSRRWSWCCSSRSCGSSGRRQGDRAGRGHALAAARERRRRGRQRERPRDEPDVGVVVPGENPIEHVIFLIKENRSFDHYFGRYPGVEGATEGSTLDCSTFEDAAPVRLKDAPLVMPHDLGHAFYPGLLSINGGEMNGFNCIALGEDLTGYSQYDRDSLPAYWAYADRFVVADHFFVDVRADVPRAPLHRGGAKLRHRR